MRRKHSMVTLVLTALSSGLLPRVSMAYIPSSSAILSSVANRRADVPFKSIVVEGRYKKGALAPVPVWEALLASEGHRVEIKGETETTVILTRGAKRWRFTMGQESGVPETIRLDLITTFFGRSEGDSGGQKGQAFLSAAKVDESVVTLSRLERRVVYIIGARPWESDKPQLWIDKEHMVPVRLIQVDPTEGTTDTRLLGFGSAITGHWYPERIERWVNGELKESFTYRSLRVNEEVDAKLFKPSSPPS